MRILLTGARGQLGTDLARELEGRAEVVAHDRSTLDLAKPDEIVARVREARPDVILNAAAYTAVDRAETEVDAARAVNAIAPGILAAEARSMGALLVHYSTDYVFDGTKRAPYVETDATAPLNVYGGTKLEGESAIAKSGCDHLILRTSWVYAPHGKNFMLTMLRLAATKEELRVVADQRGAPTSSRQLARATLELLAADARPMPLELLAGNAQPLPLRRANLDKARAASGVYHATAGGETTWCDFARQIFASWSKRAGPAFRIPRVVAIPSSEYPTPARRPANSVLSNARLAETFDVRLSSWRDGVEEALSALPVR
jgi:dTDP-4-dehydrorhamnose reductase